MTPLWFFVSAIFTTMKSFISTIIRTATIPFAIVMYLNIENAAEFNGIDKLLPENWELLRELYLELRSWVSESWVAYVAIFLLGAIVYEWLIFLAMRVDSRSSRFYKLMTQMTSSQVVRMFRKYNAADVEYLNKHVNERYKHHGLPAIPISLGNDERLVKVYTQYAKIIQDGNFDAAKFYLRGALLGVQTEDREHLLHHDIPEGTPPKNTEIDRL